jgi:transcriptional regulator with XRE-family HTH domain
MARETLGLISAANAHADRTAAVVPVQLALGLRSLALVDTDAEMRRRFAYALNSAMALKGWKAPDLAKAIGRDASTVTRWTNAETAPNLFTVKPLSAALGVRPEFLYDPPLVPEYPLADYLVDALADAVASGTEEGQRRGRQGPGTPAHTTARPPRAAGAGRG